MKGTGDIMSLMTSLSIGVSGLKTAQTGVNTTAHNLSNVSTQGYSRQQVLNVDFAYNTIGYTHINYTQTGMGTAVSVVRQNRDEFLDKSYRQEVGREYFYDVQSDAIEEVENVFGELEGVAYQETLTNVWSAIEELVKEPDSIVKRTALIETANTFTRRSQDIYEQLENYQVNLNTQIRDAVNRINIIGKKILDLNHQIARYEAGSEQANDYRDYRNSLIDELAEYVHISCKEDPTSGVVNISIEGRQFVTPDYVFELDTERVDDTTTMLNVIWKGDNSVFDLEQKCTSEKNSDIGRLKGLLVARGNKVARYIDIPDMNSNKYYKINDAGEREFLAVQYAEDVDKYNNTVGASVIMSAMSGFDRLVHGVVTAINDALSPNEHMEKALEELGLSTDTDSVSYSTTRTIGTITVQEEIVVTNEGKRTVTYMNGELVDEGKLDTSYTLADLKIWDEYNSAVGMDEYSTPREAMFNRQYKERYSESTITVTDEDGNTYDRTIWVYNDEFEDDPYSLFTIKQLVMNEEVEQEPSKLPLSGNEYKGLYDAYDAETCDRLEEIWERDFSSLNPNILTSNTFFEYYTAFMGDIATVGNEYRGMHKNQEELVTSIDNSRQEVSGVSSDEELTNMIMYQHAYNASSRYITAVDQMLEHLLAKLG